MPVHSSGVFHPPASDGQNLSGFSPILSQNKTTNASTSASPAPDPKLVKSAHEFEASLMQELLKPLLPGQNSLDGEGDEDGSGSNSALSAYAGEALGKALSEHGGLGIATRIIQQLSTASNHSGNTPVLKPKRSLTPNSVGR